MFSFVSLVSTFLLAATGARALAIGGDSDAAPLLCGSTPSHEVVKAAEAHFKAALVSAAELKSDLQGDARSTVPVYFHIIYANETYEGGYVPGEHISGQLSTLNADFASTKLSFVLQDISRVQNATWFERAAPDGVIQTEMKNALRQGGPETLNFYTVGFPGISLLGYATFPNSYEEAALDDGVVVKYNTLTGGSYPQYELGKTGTHEVGHWVGLYHTFQGASCTGEGDSVLDTPAELSPAFDCSAPRDTCPNQAGVDPTYNYMDYTVDKCKTGFSEGQSERLKDQLAMYRNVHI